MMEHEESILNGLKYAQSVRSLDEKTGLKVALALAGMHPILYSQIMNVIRSQNVVPASTLVLNPVPALKIMRP